MIDIQPLSDLVMVEVDATKREKAGLLLPKEVQPDLEEGKAVAFGPDLSTVIRREIEMCAGGVIYAAGDHEATAYERDGRKFLFIRERDLMGALFLGRGDRFPRIQSALGKWSLMVWEEAKETLLGGLLVRPVQQAKAHFTGNAVIAGTGTVEIERGKRYFFEQFSDFKSWSENGTRYAFVPERAVYCEVPAREADICLAPSEVSSLEFEESMR